MQIRRGVALQRQHLVPTENVIALAVRQQVGVFHRAEADDARDFASLRLRQIRILFGNDFEGPFLGFVEQIGQLHRLAAARFERLAVLAENRAEPDVGQLGASSSFGASALRTVPRRCRQLLPFAERGEELLEMQLLPAVGDVNDFVRLPGFEPVFQRRQIGGRVIESAVAFADERRMRLQLRNIVEENRHRAFAFPGDAFGQQFVHQRFQRGL